MRSKDAHKQLARTSLIEVGLYKGIMISTLQICAILPAVKFVKGNKNSKKKDLISFGRNIRQLIYSKVVQLYEEKSRVFLVRLNEKGKNI